VADHWLIIVSLVLLLVLILQAAILWQLARLPV
jgi:hypothetical protein